MYVKINVFRLQLDYEDLMITYGGQSKYINSLDIIWTKDIDNTIKLL